MPNLPINDDFLKKEFITIDFPEKKEQKNVLKSIDSLSESEKVEALLDSGMLSFDPVKKEYFFVVREKESVKTSTEEVKQDKINPREKLYQDQLITSPALFPVILTINPYRPSRSPSLEVNHVLFKELPHPIVKQPQAYFTSNGFGQLLSVLRHLVEIKKNILQYENEFLLKASEQVIAATEARLEAIEQTFQGEIALAQARYTSAIVAIVGYSLALAAISISIGGILFDRKPSYTKKKLSKSDRKKEDKEESDLDISLEREKENEHSPNLDIHLSKERSSDLDVELRRQESEDETLDISLVSEGGRKETSRDHPGKKGEFEQTKSIFSSRQAIWPALLDPSVMPIFIQAVGELATAVKDGMSVQATLLEGKGRAAEVLTETWQKFSFKELEKLDEERSENNEEISSLLSVARRLSQLTSRINAWSIRA